MRLLQPRRNDAYVIIYRHNPGALPRETFVRVPRNGPNFGRKPLPTGWDPVPVDFVNPFTIRKLINDPLVDLIFDGIDAAQNYGRVIRPGPISYRGFQKVLGDYIYPRHNHPAKWIAQPGNPGGLINNQFVTKFDKNTTMPHAWFTDFGWWAEEISSVNPDPFVWRFGQESYWVRVNATEAQAAHDEWVAAGEPALTHDAIVQLGAVPRHRWLPRFMPEAFSPLDYAPNEEPVPYRLIRRHRDSQPQTEPDLVPRRAVDHALRVIQSVQLAPGRPPIIVNGGVHKLKPPPNGTKEAKGVVGRAMGAFLKAYGSATEFGDFVEALHGALPKELQKPYRKKGWLTKDELARFNEETNSRTFKALRVYRNLGKLDINKAMENLIKNQGQDAAIGGANSKARKALANLGVKPVGVSRFDPLGLDRGAELHFRWEQFNKTRREQRHAKSHNRKGN